MGAGWGCDFRRGMVMGGCATGMPPEGESWEELREAPLRSGLEELWEEAPPEGVFRTGLEEGAVWRSIPTLLLAGALIGLCFWVLFDGNLSWGRLLVYGTGGAVALCSFSLFPPLQKSLKEIRITPDGFSVVRKGGTKEYAWSDLEAARFQDYPVASLGGRVHCFLFRAGGKNVEVELGGLDVPTRRAFYAAAGWYLWMFDVPKQAPAMPSFGNTLSLVGAWVFVGGAFGMLVAHLLGYHTLGTVFGLAVMATGTCIAFLTRRERLSRLVLAATATVLVAGGAIIWALDIDVRDVLNEWEMRERRLGRAPWSAPKTKAGAGEEADLPGPPTRPDPVNQRGGPGPTPPASTQ